MAIGDIINNITVLAGGADLDYQPAVGVEVIMQHVLGSDGAAGLNSDAGFYNGSTFVELDPVSTIGYKKIVLGATNTNYLRIHNNAANTNFIGYSGVQIK